MMFSARFDLATGQLVGIVLTRDVPLLAQEGFGYESLPDFFDPSRYYIQGSHRNFSVREIPSVQQADFMAEYPPARQLQIMRKTLASIIDPTQHPEFTQFHQAMESFDE